MLLKKFMNLLIEFIKVEEEKEEKIIICKNFERKIFK